MERKEDELEDAYCKSAYDRLRAEVEIKDGDHWKYKGEDSARFQFNKRYMRPAAAATLIAHKLGRMPTGMQTGRKAGCPATCCNPDHMQLRKPGEERARRNRMLSWAAQGFSPSEVAKIEEHNEAVRKKEQAEKELKAKRKVFDSLKTGGDFEEWLKKYDAMCARMYPDLRGNSR